MLKSILKIWKNKDQILQGIRYKYFPNAFIEKIAAERDKICRQNTCGQYDSSGTNKKCFVPFKPCCAACGCNLSFKHRSLKSKCGLSELGQEPLWKEKMSEQEELDFRERSGIPHV